DRPSAFTAAEGAFLSQILPVRHSREKFSAWHLHCSTEPSVLAYSFPKNAHPAQEPAGMHLNGKPPVVMVVDDDLAMCNFLRSFLAERGYQAITMSNAEEAVKRYHAERPAAVILDVVIPGSMDGLEALAAFKKIDREVPVIVLSGQGRTNTVVQAMK